MRNFPGELGRQRRAVPLTVGAALAALASMTSCKQPASTPASGSASASGPRAPSGAAPTPGAAAPSAATPAPGASSSASSPPSTSANTGGASTKAAAPPPPTDGGYDPSGEIFRGADPVELYVRAPRDERWGPVVAAALLPILRADLERMVPGVEALHVNCKLLGCVFQVDGKREALPAALAVLGLVTLGPHTVEAPVSDSRAELLFFTDRRMADPSAFIAWYHRTRKQALAALKSGRRPPLPGIPLERLPAE